MHSFGGRPRERIQILLWFIQSSLLSKLWVRCFCLGYSNILFLWWPFPDIPNEGDWWVRDRLLPSFSQKGSTWLQVILLSYGLFPTESEWGLLASIQWKAWLASVFTTLQIFSSKGVWWVRDCSLPSFSDMKASLRLVWLVSFYGDGGVGFVPAQYFYLNMGVKRVMVKDQSLARRSVC